MMVGRDRPAAAELARGLILRRAPGLSGFLLPVRSGLKLRFADPALTMRQMVYAIVAMAAACFTYPPLRRLLSHDGARGIHVHMRIGFLAGLTAWRAGEPLRDALARADHALCEARTAGCDGRSREMAAVSPAAAAASRCAP
jgi:hypothetical protein